MCRVGKALAQARTDKKDAEGKSMTQKELATAVNAKQQDVNCFALKSEWHVPEMTDCLVTRLPTWSQEKPFLISSCSGSLSVSLASNCGERQR